MREARFTTSPMTVYSFRDDELLDARDDLERGQGGRTARILVAHRSAEDRHEPVAEELFDDDAVVARDASIVASKTKFG